VGRLELHVALRLHRRSGACGRSDLRVQRTSGIRSCPLLSTVDRSPTDPARTEPGSGPVRSRTLALRSTATRGLIAWPGTASPCRRGLRDCHLWPDRWPRPTCENPLGNVKAGCDMGISGDTPLSTAVSDLRTLCREAILRQVLESGVR
jgi:hypothetical protein